MLLQKEILQRMRQKNKKKIKLDQMAEEKTRGCIIRSRAQQYESGEICNIYFLNLSKRSYDKRHIREGTFFIRGWGGGGGPGLRRVGSFVIFLQIGEGQTCFILSRGRVTVLARKNYSVSLLFCIYKQSYQSRLI